MKRSRNRARILFDPRTEEPFRLSRTKLELFIDCPRCFYLDRRLGIERPSGPPFTLNITVDLLLKREFDQYRARGEAHPLMKKYGVDAVPFQHPELPTWRENFRGIEVHHRETNLIITGAIDDVWVKPSGELIIVDYKATSTERTITLDDEWKQVYKRQMEIYQWLFRRNGFRVSDTGYFVYVNADKGRASFDSVLAFSTDVLPYTGNGDWVEPAILEAHRCLLQPEPPFHHPDCEWCRYRQVALHPVAVPRRS